METKLINIYHERLRQSWKSGEIMVTNITVTSFCLLKVYKSKERLDSLFFMRACYRERLLYVQNYTTYNAWYNEDNQRSFSFRSSVVDATVLGRQAMNCHELPIVIVQWNNIDVVVTAICTLTNKKICREYTELILKNNYPIVKYY